MTQDTPMSGTGFGNMSGTDVRNSGSMGGATNEHICSSCGARHGGEYGSGSGLEQFLGRIGISEEMMNNLKSSMQSVDVEEYLNTARDYLKNGSTKATTYAKENPGKVAAGVAVLAVGAGLLISALNNKE